MMVLMRRGLRFAIGLAAETVQIEKVSPGGAEGYQGLCGARRVHGSDG